MAERRVEGGSCQQLHEPRGLGCSGVQVGFGVSFMPLSMASIYGESWFCGCNLAITILAGLLLTPLFGQKIPRKQLGNDLLILLGIVLIQIPYFGRGLGEGGES